LNSKLTLSFFLSLSSNLILRYPTLIDNVLLSRGKGFVGKSFVCFLIESTRRSLILSLPRRLLLQVLKRPQVSKKLSLAIEVKI